MPTHKQLTVEVPALKVSPVFVVKTIAAVIGVVEVEFKETVLLPRLIVRVLLLLDDRDVAVTL